MDVQARQRDGAGQRLSNPAIATRDQITYRFTDSQFEPRWIQPWQKFLVASTACSGSTVIAHQLRDGKRGAIL